MKSSHAEVYSAGLRLSLVVLISLSVFSVSSPSQQLEALHERVGTMIAAAGRMGVNIVCLQEAWSMFLVHYHLAVASPVAHC